MTRNVVILLGGPGAGKGTQADIIAHRLKFPHISTGQLLRAEVTSATELGLRVKSIMEGGGLVSDEIVRDLVATRINQKACKSGFVLDGYPRDIHQAVMFGANLPQTDRLMVIDIDIDPEKIIPRLTGRRTCQSCDGIFHTTASPPRDAGVCDRCRGFLIQRPDDREDVIRERFKMYYEMTRPLAELYQKQGVYHIVDGMQTPEAVFRDIRRLLEREMFVSATSRPSAVLPLRRMGMSRG